jgi:hypothetical protein
MMDSDSISNLSIWVVATAGNFRWSLAVTTPRNVVSGDTLTLTTLVLGNNPLAA